MDERELVPLDAVGSGKSAAEAKDAPDAKDQSEVADLTSEQQSAAVEALHQSNLDAATNRDLRKGYANKVYWSLCAYSIICAALLLLAGWKVCGFQLPDIVLTALVGTTATAAIGLVGFVVNGLFKNSN